MNTAFESESALFADYSETVRGAVRYELTFRNLQPFLHGQMSILDVGGGAGIDSRRLVEAGHFVTIIEPAEEQCKRAEWIKHEVSDDKQDHLTIKRGYVSEIKDQYDMVLSHGVAMYLEDPQEFVNELSSRLRVGGILSVLEKGYQGTKDRLTAQRDRDNETMLDTQGKVNNNMGREVTAFRPEGLADIIQNAGCTVLSRSGVRVLTEHVSYASKDFSAETLEKIFAAEQAVGSDPHTWHRGQMLHFIAKKS